MDDAGMKRVPRKCEHEGECRYVYAADGFGGLEKWCVVQAEIDANRWFVPRSVATAMGALADPPV